MRLQEKLYGLIVQSSILGNAFAQSVDITITDATQGFNVLNML